MSKDDLDTFLGAKRKRSRDTGTGLTRATLHLPPQQRRLLTWLKQQQRCTLTEIANHFQEEEAAMSEVLTELVAANFLETQEEEEKIYYQPQIQDQADTSNKFYQSLIDEQE